MIKTFMSMTANTFQLTVTGAPESWRSLRLSRPKMLTPGDITIVMAKNFASGDLFTVQDDHNGGEYLSKGWAIERSTADDLNFADHPRFHKVECKYRLIDDILELYVPAERQLWVPKHVAAAEKVELFGEGVVTDVDRVRLDLGTIADYFDNTSALEMPREFMALIDLPFADVLRRYQK